MNENVDPKNVNPHFEEPGHPLRDNNLQHNQVVPLPTMAPTVQPCPSCGHCPTCGRGPTYNYGPFWQWHPNGYWYTSTFGSGVINCSSGTPGDGNL